MTVRYTRQALADLEEARRYIALDRPAAAASVAVSLRRAIDGLRLFPDRGRPGRVAGTRELVVIGTPFVVAYRVADPNVDILAILHGARMWPMGFG
ncbi:MAG: type II toxin-antitoxin system RelE/ParE family toxin [Janthinobacterium lividum]